MYKRILVPVDGSKTAETILPFAEKVAGPLDAEVILLHVIADRRGEFVFPTRVEAEAYLNTLAKGLEDVVRVRTGIRFGSGSVPGAILAAAGALDTDLIAMATEGRTGLTRLLLGSVAEAVLREAHVPVLMIRTAAKAVTLAGEP